MSEIASAFVSLMPSARGFGSKMNSELSGEVSGSAKKQGLTFGKMFAAAGGALAAAGIGSFLKDSIGEAREAQKVGALTAQVIKTTGGAANITAGQVGKLATAISNKTGIDDEAIQSASNLLLTFTNLRNEVGKGNDIFNQATKIATDMGAALGKEPKAAAIQLGKALNDPVKGMTALTKVGVSFTEGQKKQVAGMVEAGNTLGAQKIILAELNKEFGGAAAASSTAGEKAAVAFGNLKEQIGTALLPVIDRVAGVLTSKAIPAVSGFIAGITSGQGAGGLLATAMGAVRTVLTDVGAALTGTLLPSLRNLWAALSPTLSEAFNIVKMAAQGLVAGIQALGPTLLAVTGFINAHKTAVTAIALTVGTAVVAWKAWQFGIAAWAAVTKAAAAVQAALNVVMAANPIGLVIVALAALAVGLTYAYKHSETFRNAVNAAFAAVKGVVGAVVGWLGKYVPQVFAAVAGAIKTYVNVYKSVVTAAFNGIRAVVSAVMGFIGPFVRTQLAVAKAAFEAIKGVLSSAGQAFGKFASAVRDKIGEAIHVIQGVVGKIKAAFSGAATMLYSAGADIIRGLINGIKGMAGQAASAAVSVVKNALASAKGALGIHSPSKKFAEVGMWSMEGLRKGIDDNADKPVKAMESAMKRLRESLEKQRDSLKSTLDGVKSDFASLASSISGAFTGNMFEATTGAGLFESGVATMGNLEALKRALKKLRSWNLDPKFLSALFSSGNSALILDLASGPRWQATNSAGLFGTNQSLANQLGGQVARNQYGPKLDRLENRLDGINDKLKHLPKQIGHELGSAAGASARRR